MSRFLAEAFFIGAKNGLLLSLALYVTVSYLVEERLGQLRKPLVAGFLAACAVSGAVFTLPVTMEIRDTIVKLTGYVFGLFYLMSLGALIHLSGTDLLGPVRRLFPAKLFLIPVVFLLSALYVLPDMAGGALYVADLYALVGRNRLVPAAGALGLFGVLLLAALLRGKKRSSIIRLFDLPQVLLSLALIKLIGGGIRGFAELSLIPAVQAGLTKLVHDAVHQILVLVLVPDHLILSTTTWDFIGVLFGSAAGLLLSLGIMVIPLVFFLVKHFSSTVTVPPAVKGGASKRLFVASIRTDRFFKSLPVFLFLLVIVGTWFHESGEATASFYMPEAKPVTEINGKIIVPLQGPAENLLDGGLHKLLIKLGSEEVKVLIMKRSNGTLAVCLDACEICPPEGYGAATGHVVCISCKTPIPIDTLGTPGGCNPIPLAALVTDKEVQIEVADIREQFAKVKSGETKENISR